MISYLVSISDKILYASLYASTVFGELRVWYIQRLPFLQKMAHPGSLSEKDSEQVSLIMDLAQQAEKITPNMTLQVGTLSFFIAVKKQKKTNLHSNFFLE